MSLYRATNLAVDTTTGLAAGTSFATGIKVAAQIHVPDSVGFRIIEYGYSQDVATATLTLAKLQTTDTPSTMSTAFSTTLIKPVYSNDSRGASGTMSTAATGYGNGSLTSRTSVRDIKCLYVPQVYEYEWPLGREPIVGNGTGENYLQLILNTTATVNVIWWLVWDEL